MIDLKELAGDYARKINSRSNKVDYVVVTGGDFAQIEEFVGELWPNVKIPVYAGEQFPNSPGKLPINLDSI